MNQLTRAALGVAVAASVFSVADAVLRATTDVVPPWDADHGTAWGYAGAAILLSVTFVVLAAVLVRAADSIDAGSAARRWIRRVLAADLVVLAVGGAVSTATAASVLGAVAGVSFLLMFVLAVVLGATLLRRPETRGPATVLVATLPVIGLTFLVEALAPGWGHPAYAETAVYVGLALLGRSAVAAPVPTGPLAAARG
ncbi:hypothetical protein [Geodermatophilus sp. URMC 64]